MSSTAKGLEDVRESLFNQIQKDLNEYAYGPLNIERPHMCKVGHNCTGVSQGKYLCACGSDFSNFGEYAAHADYKSIPGSVSLAPAEPTRSTADFFSLIEDSLGTHAARKGYSDSGADGENKLYEFTHSIGASAGHAMGEIIYKSTEYMKEPREVLLIKIASWAFLEWKYGIAAK